MKRVARWYALLSKTEGGFMPKADLGASEDLFALTRRRLFIGGAATLFCAPAIVRAANIMTVRKIIVPVEGVHYGFNDRLRINWMYRTGQLQDHELANAVQWGLLDNLVAKRPLPPRQIVLSSILTGLDGIAIMAAVGSRQ
jgi:hypothetical protein